MEQFVIDRKNLMIIFDMAYQCESDAHFEEFYKELLEAWPVGTEH